MRGRDEIVHWAEILEKPDEDVLSVLEGLPDDAKGTAIHSWIESEYRDLEGVEFENPVMTDGGEVGFYDAYDGNFVYEFKTKNCCSMRDDLLPFDEDVEQVEKYMAATDTGYGVLVYICRDDFDVEEYVVSR